MTTRVTFAMALLCGMAIIPAAALAMDPYLPRSQKAFTKADTDNNGQVTSAELKPKAEKRFDVVDADHNGQVSMAELNQALEKAMERRRDRIMASLDADKDGTVTKAELDAAIGRLIAAADLDNDGGVSLDEARNYKASRMQQNKVQGSAAGRPSGAVAMASLPRSPRAFASADTDKNGQVTRAELSARAEKRFDAIDADHNGQITVAELTQALQKTMERRRDRIMASLDANKDGEVTKAELDAAVDRLIAAADLDSDGGVSFEEARNYRLAKLQKPATGKSVN